jgi:hypothetical protein
MPRTSPHVLHDVEAVAFVGSPLSGWWVEFGTDGASGRAPTAASSDGVVRLQWHLDPHGQ